MKKVVLILAVVMVLVSFSADALTLTEYGAPLLRDNFETTDDLNAFPYNSVINGEVDTEAVTYSTQRAHSGTQSVKINLSELNSGDTVSVARSFYGLGVDPTAEKYYVSFFVSGDGLAEDHIGFYCKYSDGIGVLSKLGKESDADGWIKVWGILQRLPGFDITQSGYVGVSITKKDGVPETVYMDSITMCPVPEKINFKNRNIPNSGIFNLDEIIADAYNSEGAVDDLKNSHMTQWEVLSGNAEISGRNLVYDTSVNKIVLRGEFFGCSDEVTLYVTDSVKETTEKAVLSAEEITVTGGVYSTVVSNNGNAPGDAFLIVYVFDEGRLCDMYVSTSAVAPGQSVTIRTEQVTGEDVRAVVWDSIFGCVKIKQ